MEGLRQFLKLKVPCAVKGPLHLPGHHCPTATILQPSLFPKCYLC